MTIALKTTVKITVSCTVVSIFVHVTAVETVLGCLMKDILEAKAFLPNKLHAGCQKWHFLSLVTLPFKLVRVRDQTRLPREFGADLFSGS